MSEDTSDLVALAIQRALLVTLVNKGVMTKEEVVAELEALHTTLSDEGKFITEKAIRSVQSIPESQP